MIKMSDKVAADCRDLITQYTGLVLTEDQFDDLMQSNQWLVEEIMEWGSAHDTLEREALMNALAIKIAGCDWPCYGDGEEAMSKFSKLFYENAEKLGYKSVRENNENQ